jgi:hypothetical protein
MANENAERFVRPRYTDLALQQQLTCCCLRIRSSLHFISCSGAYPLFMDQVAPQTRLLEKRRQMFEVQEKLEARKEEFARREVRFALESAVAKLRCNKQQLCGAM